MISTLPDVVVRVGAVPPDQRTEPGQVMVFDPPPPCVKYNVAPYCLPLAGTLLNVSVVILVLRSTAKLLADEQLIVVLAAAVID